MINPLFGVDISNHQGNIDVPEIGREGFVGVISKASEGSTYEDWTFVRDRDLSHQAGIAFVGYHYLRAGDPKGNAACWDRAVKGDRSIPCMVDWEEGGGNINDYWDFRHAVEALGYKVTLTYIPRWYWDGIGNPDLSNIGPVMASSYGPVGETGFASALYESGGQYRWQQYANANVQILQFTNAGIVSGQKVDCWAYRGSMAQMNALLIGQQLVYGAIGELYNSLGGPGGFLGQVRDAETGTPDGVGRYNHFDGGMIYWTPQLGAHEVHGSILALWASYGWEAGLLGYPLTSETEVPRKDGCYNHFEHGSIYFDQKNNTACEVHGLIRDKWKQISWEQSYLGYPVTNEIALAGGAFNHFNFGSIYWYKGSLEAFVVHGRIREFWAEAGWENGPLGYPTSDEIPTAGGVQQRFQNGTLVWTAATNNVTKG